MNKNLIDISNLQKFLSKLNEKFALKKAMKGISEDEEGNIIIGEEGLVPTPDENSKGKFLRSDGTWSVPGDSPLYESMSQEEGIAGVSKVDRVINAKNLKQIVNSDGFLTSLDSSKLTGIIDIKNLPQGALERILIVSSKEERLRLLDTDVQLGDVVKEADTGLMYYVINTEKLNSEEGYTQFTAGSASSVPWSGVTDKPTIPTVNNATLTIQKNGTNVQTFTANSSSNKTANITVPTKVSELTNDSKFVNTTQLAAKANDADVVHKSGDEDINGTKSFKTMPKIAGTYLGNELSTNERTCLYLTSNRDTIDKSGAYLVRFRQNRDQGALEGVSYISQDILENGTRYPRVLVSGLAFGSDFTPSFYYLSSQSSMPSQLGREDLPWDKAYLTDCIVGNTLEVKGDVWVGGDQLMITSDETEVFTGRRISWAKNAGTLPTKAYNLNFSLGGNNSAGWANRIGGFRVALNTTGDVETAMYAHDTTGASKGQGMIGIYYRRATDSYETIAPTPPAGDNSTQIATTAWVTAKDNNVVHKTGNETITGLKTFERNGNFINTKNSKVYLGCKPTSNEHQWINFLDKNDEQTGYISNCHYSGGANVIELYAQGKYKDGKPDPAGKKVSTMFRVGLNNAGEKCMYTTASWDCDFIPRANDTYTLGNSSFKWKSIYGNLVGNADTATQFSANKSVTLTGDVTGTASSKGGWSVATTLANSGVTAGSYGPTANVTGNNNATISVPQITVDAKGRVTSVVNRTLTCKNNTYTVPTKVSQLTNDKKYVSLDALGSGDVNGRQETEVGSVMLCTCNCSVLETTSSSLQSNRSLQVPGSYLTPISWVETSGGKLTRSAPEGATYNLSGTWRLLGNFQSSSESYMVYYVGLFMRVV